MTSTNGIANSRMNNGCACNSFTASVDRYEAINSTGVTAAYVAHAATDNSMTSNPPALHGLVTRHVVRPVLAWAERLQRRTAHRLGASVAAGVEQPAPAAGTNGHPLMSAPAGFPNAGSASLDVTCRAAVASSGAPQAPVTAVFPLVAPSPAAVTGP